RRHHRTTAHGAEARTARAQGFRASPGGQPNRGTYLDV
ncbi:hypothetical protein Pa4123_51440, partial [Phytohabitans aurantiacus]